MNLKVEFAETRTVSGSFGGSATLSIHTDGEVTEIAEQVKQARLCLDEWQSATQQRAARLEAREQVEQLIVYVSANVAPPNGDVFLETILGSGKIDAVTAEHLRARYYSTRASFETMRSTQQAQTDTQDDRGSRPFWER